MYFSDFDPMRPRRIPVRRARQQIPRQFGSGFGPPAAARPVVAERAAAAEASTRPINRSNEVAPRNGVASENGVAPKHEPAPVEPAAEPSVKAQVTPPAEEHDWREKAQEMQAEMDNFRKRQMRRADEAIAQERERLLALVLPIADNLDRAVAHQAEADDTLRQGIDLTRRQLSHVLANEGVIRLETIGQPFDPAWHEAIAVVPTEAASNSIIEEVEAGYKIGDKLLRPAKVVVAA